MKAKIAGMNAIHKKANAIGVALMVGAVEKVGLEMDVMALLGGLLITNVCLNHQVCFLRLQNNKIKENSKNWSHTSMAAAPDKGLDLPKRFTNLFSGSMSLILN